MTKYGGSPQVQALELDLAHHAYVDLLKQL